MTSPAGPGPTYSVENLRLAYEQQVENVREGKRLQWQMAYLGYVALAALVGAYQLRTPRATSLEAYIFTGLGALVSGVTSWFVWKARLKMGTYRRALEAIAEKLDDSRHPYLKRLLGVPADYGAQSDAEPFFLIGALIVGAVILAWLLLDVRTPTAPPLTHVGVSVAGATWWPVSAEGSAAIGSTMVALVALLKQYRDERNRRKAVDGRISAQAYAARRTIQHGWLENPLRHPAGVVAGQGEVNAGTEIVGEFGAVEVRFEKMAADAPDGTKDVGRAVRDALVLFYRATHRIQSDIYRVKLSGGPKNVSEFVRAFEEFEACARTLAGAIDPDLRNK